MRHRPRPTIAALALVVAGMLSGCGGAAPAGPPVLTWYINPDSGGQKEIAARCTAAAGGRYTIVTTLLPRSASEQRQQLVRRLAANDSSIDLMSLDPPYIPELAEAGFLAPIPPDMAARVSKDVVRSALEGASWREKLVTVPFWANTQLLWYRKSVAQAAGLDMNKPVTWDQLIAAAQARNTQFAVQGRRDESLTVWINALVASAGGQVITNPNVRNPKEVKLGLASPEAVRGTAVMRAVADAKVGGPALSTSGEDENVASFEAGRAGFMVNWPFVWTKAQSGVKGGTLKAEVPADYGWTLYPRVTADRPSAPPYGGINIGISAFSRNVPAALSASECVTSAQNQAYYFATNGNPAANSKAFDDPAVRQAFPMAPLIRQSLQQAEPRPQTPYYSEVSEGLQRVYHPPGAVDPQTGQRANDLITAVLAKKKLL
jgi:multiple sugar transport system substrate-binding protein